MHQHHRGADSEEEQAESEDDEAEYPTPAVSHDDEEAETPTSPEKRQLDATSPGEQIDTTVLRPFASH